MHEIHISNAIVQAHHIVVVVVLSSLVQVAAFLTIVKNSLGISTGVCVYL